MRVLICDHHVVFAESLAHLFESRGMRVVAVTYRPRDAIAALRAVDVDVCLFDVRFGPQTAIGLLPELCAASPGTRVVLLTAEVDHVLLAAGRAAGVHGIADKRQAAADLIDVIDRVYGGESVLPADHPLVTPAPRRPANDAQRLASFLTPRERQVLSALVRGDDTNRLARSLGIAAATARCHIQNVLTKLGVHSRLEAATTAVRNGMVSPETGAWLAHVPAGVDGTPIPSSPPIPRPRRLPPSCALSR
jgi:two-component system nitrate/nitrite response regulator NarL